MGREEEKEIREKRSFSFSSMCEELERRVENSHKETTNETSLSLLSYHDTPRQQRVLEAKRTAPASANELERRQKEKRERTRRYPPSAHWAKGSAQAHQSSASFDHPWRLRNARIRFFVSSVSCSKTRSRLNFEEN